MHITYHSDEYRNEFCEPDGAGCLYDSDVDQDVSQVEYYQGSQKPQPVPGTVQVNCKRLQEKKVLGT